MKIGIAVAKNTNIGTSNRLYTINDNWLGIFDLLREHDVTFLTRIINPKDLPSNIKYEPDLMDGKFDIILFSGFINNLIMRHELLRAMYVLLNFGYTKAIELKIEFKTDVKLILKYQDTIKRRIIKQDKLLSKRNLKYGSMILNRDFNDVKYEVISNCSSDFGKSFPFTFLDYENFTNNLQNTSSLVLGDNLIYRNLYIGMIRDRLSKFKLMNVPSDLYVGIDYSDDYNDKNTQVFDRVKVNDVETIYKRYLSSIVVVDHKLKFRGWILLRIAESIAFGTPVLIDKELTDGIYGYEDISKIWWFNVDLLDMQTEFDKLMNLDYRQKLVDEQRVWLTKIIDNFKVIKYSKFNHLLRS